MKLLDIVHPAAKTLVDISLSQDSEVRYLYSAFGLLTRASRSVLKALKNRPANGCAILQVGDGTTTVVLLASEFLKEAKAFIDDGVHPRVRTTDTLPSIPCTSMLRCSSAPMY